MTEISSLTATITTNSPEKLDRSALSWACFEAGRNPYVILCTIYILAPYIATTVFSDPVVGQATIASWHTLAGIIVAVTGPFLGAIADRFGNRKPILGLVTFTMVLAIFSLWWALPAGQGGLSIVMIGALTTALGVMFAYTEVLHNAMLPTASTPATLPLASGLGLALGNLASVVFLIFVLWGLAFPGRVDWSFVPSQPLFGLDTATHETSRIVAPMTAIWFAMAALPLFFFSRDKKPSGMKPSKAAIDGVVGMFKAVGRLFRVDRNAGLYLIARMLYVDGKTAILIVAGVTAAGVFGWDLLEMSAYGVILSIFAVFGGLVAGRVDARIGAKWSIIAEIGVTLVCLIVLTAQSKAHVFGLPVVPDTPEGAVRSAAHEDINFLTLMPAARGAGLQLLDRDGTWLPIKADPSTLIVDSGDMLARLTNGVIPATTHRVVNPEGPNVSRYSMPFFMHPTLGTSLDVLPSCRSHAPVPPPITAGELLDERLRAIGLKK